MNGGQVTFLAQYRQSERLVDRARRRRNEALGFKTVWVVQTTMTGEDVTEHRFTTAPRLVDLIARTGAEACLLDMRIENQSGRRTETAAVVAE